MKRVILASAILSLLAIAGCGASSSRPSLKTAASNSTAPEQVKLSVGSYSVTKDVYTNKIFPDFQKYWKSKTGQQVVFQGSFDASGAEARTIANGLDVDVAALSLEADIAHIQKAGLITHDWKSRQYKGMITNSIVAIGVRKGNPKGIRDWTDLTKKGISVDLPNPQTSGGAKWDINAIYGAGLQNSTPAHAKSLLASVVKNVVNMDKSGEASISTFTSGVGDAVVSYENSILSSSNNLQQFDEVIPNSTILIENPVALIDKNVDRDGNRKVAEAFVGFLTSKQAQLDFAAAGFRPVNAEAAKDVANKFTTPPNLFNISFLGGWSRVDQTLYSQGGIFNQVLAAKS